MSINFDLAEAIKRIREMCADDDEQTLLDTLEAATDAHELADSLIDSIMDDDTTADAIHDREGLLKARRERIEWRARQKRKALLDLLGLMGVKKLERPCATISRLSGRTRAEIITEADIPSQLCKVVSTPDKTAIKAALEQGETVPGAVLVRGDDSLSMRIK